MTDPIFKPFNISDDEPNASLLKDIKHLIEEKRYLELQDRYYITCNKDIEDVRVNGFVAHIEKSFIFNMTNLGFSEIFANVLFKKLVHECTGYNYTKWLIDIAEGLILEGVSKDMLIYYILNEIEDVKRVGYYNELNIGRIASWK